jgi:hypothetical protein
MLDPTIRARLRALLAQATHAHGDNPSLCGSCRARAEFLGAAPALLDALDQAEGERQDPDTAEAIHARLAEMLETEERLLDKLETLGDLTYYVPPESVERTRENLSAIVRLSRERDTLQARVTALEQWIRDNGLHTQSCGNFGRQPCTCGLDAARAGRG